MTYVRQTEQFSDKIHLQKGGSKTQVGVVPWILFNLEGMWRKNFNDGESVKLFTKEMRNLVIQKAQELFYNFIHLFDSKNLSHLAQGCADDTISPYPAPEYTHYILILQLGSQFLYLLKYRVHSICSVNAC